MFSKGCPRELEEQKNYAESRVLICIQFVARNWKKKSELLNVYIGHLPDQLERSCCSQCVKKKKRKKRVTAALIHGLKKVRVQAHFNKPEMQIQAFEIKSFTVHHSSLKTSLPYQGMEIVQTMNSDPGLAVGKVYLAFLPEYHF